MSDFLLELRSEEIPARMQAGARAELGRLFAKEMDAAGVAIGDLIVWSTPRRLALIARDLPQATAAVREEVKGPRTSAPPQALEGFLRKTGVTQDQLVDRDGVWFAVIERPGRAMADVLAEAIAAIVRSFSWPKSMRWGPASTTSESLRWVRPLSGIIALLGGEVVPCAVEGIAAGRVTRGHRFHHSGEVTIADAASYAEALRAAHVIVDQDERAAIIREGAAKAAADAGLVLVADEGLVVENAGLTEWPVPLLGRFDEAFLAVPPEVIQLTARVNQKYFVCEDRQGKLANAFICTANIVPSDGGAAIVAGNQKVLGARLSDAKFFWEQDLKILLDAQAKKLSQITFHDKLGSVADKVERIAKLARWLVEEGIVEGANADEAERAARLCKADLVTGMVGEFPELQGIMGGYYARAQGEAEAVADAIRDHYKPVGQGDEVPTAPVTVAVSLADKLDTIVSFFGAQILPTGSKDPFALRRAVLQICQLAIANGLRLPLQAAIDFVINPAYAISLLSDHDRSCAEWFNLDPNKLSNSVNGCFKYDGIHNLLKKDEPSRVDYLVNVILKRPSRLSEQIIAFLADRLKVQQREAGVRHDLIDAVFALGGEDDLVRLLARVKALQAFVATDEGANLLAAYKRAANLLKQAGVTDPASPGEGPTGHDRALLAALAIAEPAARIAVAEERFTDAMAALAGLRAPIDAFFEGVMVNDPDADVRAFRLGLLARFTSAVHSVADFSKIEG